MNNIIEKEYLGSSIEFKVLNGEVYANATSMSKCFPSKNLSTWINSKGTEEYILELCKETNRNKDFYIDSRKGGIVETQGTWIHQELLLDLARWLNVSFRVWMDKQITTLIRERHQVKSILNTLENIEFNGSIDDLVYSKNGKPITTSRIISQYLNKKHKNVLRDIKEEIDKLINIGSNLNTSAILDDFVKTEYLDSYGRSQTEYEIGELATMQLMLKYSVEHRAKFILMFYKMKETLMSMFKVKLIEEVLPQDSRLRQYVYVIKNNDTCRIKVGVAQNVNKRLSQLQTGSDSELVLVYRSVICSNAFDVEKFMHNKFKNNHIRGEWFNVSELDVINELEKQKYVVKSELIKGINLTNTLYDKMYGLKDTTVI